MAIQVDFSNKILDFFFGKITYTPANNYYLGVSHTPIAADGTGISEPTDPSYARVAIPNDKTSFSSAVDGILSITKEFRFNEASVNWGNVIDYFITDTPTGNAKPLLYGHLLMSRNVEIGTTLVLSPNDFSIELHTCEAESA